MWSSAESGGTTARLLPHAMRRSALSLDDSPPGVGAGARPSKERCLLRVRGDALDADGDALAVAPDVEGAIAAEHKHAQSVQGKQGRRA